MKLLVSKKVLYSILFVFSVVLGFSSYLVFKNVDTISSWFKDSESPIVGNTDESKAPYFASGDRDYALGDNYQILFKVFQPEVLEYYSKDGVWYMKVRYLPVRGGEPVDLDVLLTLDLTFAMTQEFFDNIKEDDPISLASGSIIYSKHYDPLKVSYKDNDEGIKIEEIKERFPVGKRIAMRIPVDYNHAGERTEEFCSSFESSDICDTYLKLVDGMAVNTRDLFSGEGLPGGSVLVPYSISSDVQL